jgi:RecB family exonuclease
MKVRNHWTISALNDYEKCPARYQWSYLFDADDWLKLGYRVVPSTPSPAADRGTEIHQTCEDFIKGTRPDLHPEISPAWAMQVKGLKALGATAEQMWEVDCDWQQPDPSHPMWLRAKIDAHYQYSKGSLAVIDFKTGKVYNSNFEQVELYALLGFAKFDDVDTISAELWYFDSDEPYEKTYSRSQAPKLARKWEGRARPLLEATSYPEKVNRFCNWCPFNPNKGGPCKSAPRVVR